MLKWEYVFKNNFTQILKVRTKENNTKAMKNTWKTEVDSGEKIADFVKATGIFRITL